MLLHATSSHVVASSAAAVAAGIAVPRDHSFRISVSEAKSSRQRTRSGPGRTCAG